MVDQPIWQSSGNPSADYKELMRIFRGGLAERRAGRNANAYVRQNFGPGGDVTTMTALADMIRYVASKGGEPLTYAEKQQANVMATGNAAGFNFPSHTWSPAADSLATRYAQQEPGQSKLANLAGAAGSNYLIPGFGAAGEALTLPSALLRAGAGGAVSGTLSAYGQQPDLMNPDPMALAKGGAMGAGAGLLTTAATRGLQAALNPAAYKMTMAVEQGGGPEGLTNPNPLGLGMPVEMSPSMTMLARGAARDNPQARKILTDRINAELRAVQADRAAVAKGYDQIDPVPMTDPRAAQVFVKNSKIPEGGQMTFGQARDVWMQLRDKANGLLNSRYPSQRKQGFKLMEEQVQPMEDALKAHPVVGQKFTEIQDAYRQHSARVAQLEQLLEVTGGTQSRGKPIPTPPMSIREGLKDATAMSTYRRQSRAATTMAPILENPTTPEGLLAAIRGLRTPYSRLNPALTGLILNYPKIRGLLAPPAPVEQQ